MIRKVLSSKNYLGTLVTAIFQLNEWRKFVKLDNVGNILFFFFNKEEEQFWRIVRAFLWGARRLLDSDEVCGVGDSDDDDGDGDCCKLNHTCAQTGSGDHLRTLCLV